MSIVASILHVNYAILKAMLIDSHCHIHDTKFYPENREEIYKRSVDAEIWMITVGTSIEDSKEAIEFASSHDLVWATIGVHPHEAKDGWSEIEKLAAENHTSDKLVAIGEIGLDYHYSHSSREAQIEALEAQIDIALRYDLPIVFHVREAFDDFWPVLDNFKGIRGVLHSYTDTQANVERGLARGLYFGVNGISTFTKDATQQEMFKSLPLDRVLLETDAPFLTPKPYRGKINEPAFVREVAANLSVAKNLDLSDIIASSNTNARSFFSI